MYKVCVICAAKFNEEGFTMKEEFRSMLLDGTYKDEGKRWWVLPNNGDSNKETEEWFEPAEPSGADTMEETPGRRECKLRKLMKEAEEDRRIAVTKISGKDKSKVGASQFSSI